MKYFCLNAYFSGKMSQTWAFTSFWIKSSQSALPCRAIVYILSKLSLKLLQKVPPPDKKKGEEG